MLQRGNDVNNLGIHWRLLGFLVIGWTVCGHATAFAAGVDLTLGDKVSARGCSAAVPVKMSGVGGAVGGVQLDVLFPQSVFAFASCTLTAGLPGEMDATLVSDPTTPPGMQRLRIVVLNMNNSVYADGTLGTCAFSIPSSAALGTYQLQIDGTNDVPEVSDVQGSDFPWGVWTNSTVTVNAFAGCCP
jgi:hypothetical protein